MALFGVQFIITLAVATLLQKFSSYVSLARWILCGGSLVRFLHPTDEDLKALAGKTKNTANKPKGKRNYVDSKRGSVDLMPKTSENGMKTFTVPCNINILLEKAKIEEIDLLPQFMYQDYKWVVDFSASTLVVNVLIEGLSCIWPEIYTQELHLGIIWNFLVIFFALKVLFSLTAAYWRGEDTGERSMSIIFGLFFFVLAMAILVIDESILEFGLDEGYNKFSENAVSFLEKQGFSARESAPKWTFKFGLALFCGVLGAFMGFPGIRLANMYLDSLHYCKEQRFMQLLLHLNFFTPLFTILLWIKPLVRDPLVSGIWSVQSARKFEPVITDEQFDNIRYGFLFAMCILRLLLIRRHLQSHLDMAYERIEKMKKETGRITNIEIQRKVARVFFYLCAATLQYIAPTLLMLFMTLTLRTLGCADFRANSAAAEMVQSSPLISNSTREAALSLRNVFTPLLFQGITSFLVWWTCATWFLTSIFGVVYLKIFDT